MAEIKRKAKRIGTGIVGGAILIVGVIAIPYPGPGWLIVFAGLGVLATEFEWAQRLLDYARARYDAFQAWIARQNKTVKAAIWSGTALVVIATIYLLNGYGIIDNALSLNQDWLHSPFFPVE